MTNKTKSINITKNWKEKEATKKIDKLCAHLGEVAILTNSLKANAFKFGNENGADFYRQLDIINQLSCVIYSMSQDTYMIYRRMIDSSYKKMRKDV